MKASFSVAMMTLLGLLGASPATAGELYSVHAQLTHADGPALTPMMLVEAGKPASMRVQGDPEYSWEVRLGDVDAEQAQATLYMVLELAEASYTPSLRVQLGKPARLSIGELAMELVVEEHLDGLGPRAQGPEGH